MLSITQKMGYQMGYLSIALWLMLLSTACNNGAPAEVMGVLEWERLELVAESNETITKIFAEEGQPVEAGAIILSLDTRRIQAQLDAAIARQQQARFQLAELKRGPREERITEAQAKLQGAVTEEETSKKELQRAESLAVRKLTSSERVDEARARYQKATADRKAAHAVLEELLHGATAEELQQAQAAVEQAEANVRNLTITLENHTLRAPRSGIVDNLPYKLGERPAMGAVIAVVLARNTPYASVYVPEPMRANVHVGTAAQIYLDGQRQAYPGKVRMISKDAAFTPYYSLTERDRSRLSYLAEVEFVQAQSSPLPSGMPVRVMFDFGKDREQVSR